MDSNITLRRKKTFSRKSYDSLQNHNLSSSLDSDMAKSLPDLSTYDLGENEELKSKIRDLELKLISAHNEIDKLILENTKLSKQLSNRELRIKELLHICSSGAKKDDRRDSIRKKALSAIKRKINFADQGNENYTPTRNSSLDEILSTLTTKNQPSLSDTENITKKNNIAHTNVAGDTSNTAISKNEKKIMIFGSQTCSGLGPALHNARKNTNYQKYTISCLSKPDASTKDILNGCRNILMNDDDKLILSVGENDNNPYIVTSELYNILEKFKNNNIIVLSVTCNNFLNEKKLNHQLKLLCKQYKNCNFVYVNGKYKYNHMYNFYNDLCHKINLQIDYFDYKKKYLTFTKCIKQNERIAKHTVNNSRVHLPRKGTIPYYFRSLKCSTELQQQTIPKDINDNRFKKGTIPYYFTKMASNRIKNTQNIPNDDTIATKTNQQFFL